MQQWQPLLAQSFTGQGIRERIKRKGGRSMKKKTGKVIAVVTAIAAAAGVIVYRFRRQGEIH